MTILTFLWRFTIGGAWKWLAAGFALVGVYLKIRSGDKAKADLKDLKANAKTIEEVLREVAPFDFQMFFAHARPIPEAFNEPMDKILQGDFTHVWIVEEDMVLPEGILQELLDLYSPIATMDYPAVEGIMCVKRDGNGNVEYTGTGCLLIERGVLELVDKPVFSTEHIYTPEGKYIGKRDPREKIYGQHDIYFFMQLKELGIPVAVTKTIGHQRKIVEYGAKEVNDGFHKIKVI